MSDDNFTRAIENPPAPTQALKDLLREYRSTKSADDKTIAEIEERPRISALARDMITSSAEAMSAMDVEEDRIEAEALTMLLREHDRSHDDRAALLAIVKSQQEEIAALADDISRALETIAAENEARITAEKREAELRGALKYVLDVCPPINAQGEEAHERALSALAGGPA